LNQWSHKSYIHNCTHKTISSEGRGVIKNWRVIMVSANDIVRMKMIGTSLNIENGMRNIFVIAV
jgi:hypothetical protein